MSPSVTKTERIVEQLGQQIVSGLYQAGTVLSSEADLCVMFDTSRNVIREAVKVLSAKRLIDAQRYRGLFVMPRENWNYLDSDVLHWALAQEDNEVLILSLTEVRGVVEPEIVRWAAERADASDLVRIETALKNMYDCSREKNPDAFNAADIQFHKAVLIAARNPVMLQLSDAISTLQRKVFEYTFLPDDESIAQTLTEHRNLFEAIRYRKPAQAVEMVRSMIERTSLNMRNRKR